MVRKAASAAFVLAAPALVISCQMVWSIEEKHLATPEQDAGPDASSQTSIVPPPRPSGSAAPSNSGRKTTLAIRNLFLGTLSPDTLEKNAGAWRAMGYDIDGKCTTAQQSSQDSSGVCHKVDIIVGPDSLTDGDGCRDNTGGHVLAGAFTSGDNPERLMQELLDDGTSYTLLLQIEDLDVGPDDAYAPAKLYVGSPRLSSESPRKWDGTDQIAVDDRSVVGGALGSPKVAFASGYLKGDVWVSNDFRAPIEELPLPFFGTVSFAAARTATITLRFDASHQNVVESVISVALSGEAYRTAVWPGLVREAQCSESGASAAFAKVERNVDLADHPPDFVDPQSACALMSMGMRAVWAPVQAPAAVVAERPAPPLCD